MPEYRRADVPGGTYFFTLVTEQRRPFLCDDLARTLLHDSYEQCQRLRPCKSEAFVLLPDPAHAMWTLPPGDADFSTRWASIKAGFTSGWLKAGAGELGVSSSRRAHRHRGVWQRRFWEHWVRDEDDFGAHLDYIHYNPVKHGLVKCPHLYPYSTFTKWVKRGVYEPDWMCVCGGRNARRPRTGVSDSVFNVGCASAHHHISWCAEAHPT
jgi:putative transposase